MKPKPKKRIRLTPEQLDENYKKFIKGKELNPDGKKLFDKTLKKAVPKKSHSSK